MIKKDQLGIFRKKEFAVEEQNKSKVKKPPYQPTIASPLLVFMPKHEEPETPLGKAKKLRNAFMMATDSDFD